MIINGGSRSNGAFFSKHLSRADQNEQVQVVEIRGLAAQTIGGAFHEMQAVASGTRCKNYFYHANINTRDNELLTPAQWEQAVDTLENELGLTGQPRLVVEHEKEGRTHRHVVWSRINPDSMTAISDSLTYPKHEQAARKLEVAFGHEPVASVLVKDRDTVRPERRPKDWESFRGQESKHDPRDIKAEITALWHAADSGHAFAAALQAHGYTLARGDRRDFCIIDDAGDAHSLARRIAGVKVAELRQRMEGIDPACLPSVQEGRALAQQQRHAPAPTGEIPASSPGTPEPAQPAIPADASPDPVSPTIARMRAAAAPFVEAIREHGTVQEIPQHDGLPWWQRGVLQLVQAAQALLHGLRDTVRGHWQDWVQSHAPDKQGDSGRDFDHDR